MAKDPTRGIQLDFLQDDGRVELVEILESVSLHHKSQRSMHHSLLYLSNTMYTHTHTLYTYMYTPPDQFLTYISRRLQLKAHYFISTRMCLLNSQLVCSPSVLSALRTGRTLTLSHIVCVSLWLFFSFSLSLSLCCCLCLLVCPSCLSILFICQLRGRKCLVLDAPIGALLNHIIPEGSKLLKVSEWVRRNKK